MQLSITFSLVRCACGAERQAGRACLSCGRYPDEIDEDLERRRAIVRGAREREPVGDVEPLALEEALGVVGAWFDGFSEAYEATGEGSVDEAASRLRESLQELDVLQARGGRARRLRPNHAIWAALEAVLAAYNDVRDTYLDALISLTVEDAEEAGSRGQAAIDSASAALNRFNSLADSWQSVHDAHLADEHSDLMAGAEAVATLSGTTDMLELDRKGAELFARITDGDVACPASAYVFSCSTSQSRGRWTRGASGRRRGPSTSCSQSTTSRFADCSATPTGVATWPRSPSRRATPASRRRRSRPPGRIGAGSCNRRSGLRRIRSSGPRAARPHRQRLARADDRGLKSMTVGSRPVAEKR